MAVIVRASMPARSFSSETGVIDHQRSVEEALLRGKIKELRKQIYLLEKEERKFKQDLRLIERHVDRRIGKIDRFLNSTSQEDTKLRDYRILRFAQKEDKGIDLHWIKNPEKDDVVGAYVMLYIERYRQALIRRAHIPYRMITYKLVRIMKEMTENERLIFQLNQRRQ